MVPDTHLLFLHAEGLQPVDAELLPVGEPFQIRIRLAEELQLHLLKFAGPEGEVAGRDLVSEGFSDLADAEGDLLPGGALYVLKVDKNTLRGFRTQIDGILRILGNALEGLEHQVELTDLRKVMLAAGRAGNAVLSDEIHHLFLAPAVHGTAEVDAVFLGKVLDQLVRAEPFMTFLTVHQRVGEASQMTAGHPGLRIHQNGAVHAHIIPVPRDELLPPGLFYVILQLHAEVAVIPGVRQSAVDLGARIYKAPCLGERYDFFHCLFHNFLFSRRVSGILFCDLSENNVGKRLRVRRHGFSAPGRLHVSADIEDIRPGTDGHGLAQDDDVPLSHLKDVLASDGGSFLRHAFEGNVEIIAGIEGLLHRAAEKRLPVKRGIVSGVLEGHHHGDDAVLHLRGVHRDPPAAGVSVVCVHL